LKIPGFAKYGTDEVILISIGCIITGISISILAEYLGIRLLYLVMIFPLVAWCIGLWFFRDPKRSIPDEPGILVSPADGIVQDITELEDSYFPGGKARRLGIFMSPFNVHVNRFPCSGEVIGSEHYPGECLAAFHIAAAERNEKYIVTLRLDEGEEKEEIQVRQITGALARRIICRTESGNRVKRGEQYGMIKFGSRVEVFVKSDSLYQWSVGVGQKVVGGQTVIAIRKI